MEKIRVVNRRGKNVKVQSFEVWAGEPGQQQHVATGNFYDGRWFVEEVIDPPQEVCESYEAALDAATEIAMRRGGK